MKLRSDSSLAQLTEDQRDQLFDWLASGNGYLDAIKRAAQPPPDGFGIQFHKTTLVRFYSKERQRRHAEQLAEARAANAISGDESELIANARLELAHACFEISQGPAAPQSLNALSRILNRLESLQIEQQRLALDRDRHTEQIRQWEFNAIRHAMKHHADLEQIDKLPNKDDEDKIWLARARTFGRDQTSETHEPAS